MSEQKKSAPAQPPRRGGPGGFGGMPGEKAKDFKGSIKKLLLYLGGYKWIISIAMAIAIASTVLSIFGPKILGRATNILAEGMYKIIAGTGSIDFDGIAAIMINLIVLYITSAALSYGQGFIMSGVTAKITYRLRQDISIKLHKLPLQYYDKTTHGEILSHITNDVDTINQTLSQNITQIINSTVSFVGILIMMLSISWQMTLLSLIIIPLSLTFVTVIVKKSQTHFAKQQEYLGHVNSHIEEMYGSHVIVKAFCGEKQSQEAFEVHNNHLYTAAWKSNFLSGMMMPLIQFVGNIGYVLVCILGGYLAVNGNMQIGDIQAFIQYMRQFTQPITQIAGISNVLQQTAAAAERVFALLDQPEEAPDAPDALTVTDNKAPTYINVRGDVSFEQVCFGYNPDTTIIHNFTADVKSGQKVAIVGPTGAGKTTIVKLLMRFYDINSGAIRVDGHNIQDFTRDDLRALFGMVLQDTWLYNGTIADNIRYGKLDATDEEIHNAAVAAQADHFIRTLPDGYQMVLNEEASNVSQGQKQLLTIARAILANPKILILDEATSSVDTRTEILMQTAMDHLMQGRTSFIIAHRLSTIRNADLILVMNNGDIVEQGTHTNLLAANGFYANLYNSQFEQAAD